MNRLMQINKVRKVRATFILLLTLVMILSSASSAFAVESQWTDALHEHGMARYPSIPALQWDWGRGTYVGSFDIVQFTNTNYYFTGNDDGQIYYCIAGTSDSDNICRVDTICKKCGAVISTYSFYPYNTPSHRVVTLGSHASHPVYFKIVAYDGGEFWSNNDFAGTITVGTSYV